MAVQARGLEGVQALERVGYRNLIIAGFRSYLPISTAFGITPRFRALLERYE